MCRWPLLQAMWRGVWPLGETISGLQLWSLIRYWTMSKCPCWHARCRRVRPEKSFTSLGFNPCLKMRYFKRAKLSSVHKWSSCDSVSEAISPSTSAFSIQLKVLKLKPCWRCSFSLTIRDVQTQIMLQSCKQQLVASKVVIVVDSRNIGSSECYMGTKKKGVGAEMTGAKICSFLHEISFVASSEPFTQIKCSFHQTQHTSLL